MFHNVSYVCFHICKQNVIAIYCLVVLAEDGAEGDGAEEVKGLILKL